MARLPDGMTCRGSILLGSACGRCARCDEEIARLAKPTPPMDAESVASEIASWMLEFRKHNITLDEFTAKVATVLREERARALEDAAKVAEDIAHRSRLEGVLQPGATSAAISIRALKDGT